MKHPLVNIAIATYKPQGIERLASKPLPRIAGISYVISWQAHENYPIPENLIRDDVEIFRFDKQGLSLNRNNAFDHCNAEWIVILDDDLTIRERGLKELTKILATCEGIDVITFRSITGSSKQYPTNNSILKWPLPKGYYVTSVEIAFRKSTNLRCCPELGLNSPRMHGAEEEVMLLSAIKRGLKVKFVDTTIVEHMHPSTGTKAEFTPENLRASGCFIAMGWKWSAIPRIVLKAIRISRKKKAPFMRALWYMTQGAIESPGVYKRNREYLW